MVDPVIGRAARTATLLALPVAVLAGFVAFRVLAPDVPTEPAGRAAPTSHPQTSTAVEVPAPALSEQPAAVCRGLAARLPDRLGALARRPVTAGSGPNAAYGDPPVLVSCGAAPPPPPDGAQYLQINGVCWYPAEGPAAARWSLQGREVSLVVTVPTQYTGQILVDLAKPISDSIVQTTAVCR